MSFKYFSTVKTFIIISFVLLLSASMASGEVKYLYDDIGQLKGGKFDWGSLVQDTVIGAIGGQLGESIKIPGINKGKGSWESTYNQIMTKIDRNLINNISASTLYKMLGKEFVESLVGVPIDVARRLIEQRLANENQTGMPASGNETGRK